jgi:hypothetical protein
LALLTLALDGLLFFGLELLVELAALGEDGLLFLGDPIHLSNGLEELLGAEGGGADVLDEGFDLLVSIAAFREIKELSNAIRSVRSDNAFSCGDSCVNSRLKSSFKSWRLFDRDRFKLGKDGVTFLLEGGELLLDFGWELAIGGGGLRGAGGFKFAPELLGLIGVVVFERVDAPPVFGLEAGAGFVERVSRGDVGEVRVKSRLARGRGLTSRFRGLSSRRR